MGEISNWLWSPFLDPTRIMLGVALLAVLMLTVVGALKAIRVPGELGPQERRNLSTGQWATGWFFAAARYPIVLGVVLGAAALFFSPAAPTTLLLSSRARLPATGQKWEEGWKLAVTEKNLALGENYVDAGPLVDLVCDAVRKEPGVNRWRTDDTVAVLAIAAAVRKIVSTRDLDTVADPQEVSHRSAADLAPWVVESIELAVLKGSMQRRNIERVLAKVQDRPTAIGYAWDYATAYLTSDSVRYRKTAVLIKGRQTVDVPRLEVVLWAGHDEGGFEVDALFSVGARPTTRSVSVELEFASGAVGRQISAEILAGSGLVVMPFKFPPSPKDRPLALRQVAPLTRRCTIPAGVSSPVIRVIGKDSARWQKTWSVLKDEIPAFKVWQEQSRDMRFDLASVRFTDEAAGTVVADTTVFPGSVLVYPKTFDPNPENLPRPGLETGPDEPLRGRRSAGESPGLFTWDRLPIRKQDIVSRPSGGWFVAERRPIVTSLVEGAAQRPEIASTPLMMVYVLGQETAVTCIACDPEKQGCLATAEGAPTSGYDPEPMLAFWSALLAAAQRCSDPGATASPDQGDSPTLVLTAADLQELRADALAVNLIPLLVGVLLFAMLVARGIAAAPVRRTPS